MALHRFQAQTLERQERKISGLEIELNRLNRIIESREGSVAMSYYTSQKEGLEKQIAEEQEKLQQIQERQQ